MSEEEYAESDYFHKLLVKAVFLESYKVHTNYPFYRYVTRTEIWKYKLSRYRATQESRLRSIKKTNAIFKAINYCAFYFQWFQLEMALRMDLRSNTNDLAKDISSASTSTQLWLRFTNGLLLTGDKS